MLTDEQKRYVIQQYQNGRNKPSRIANELGVSSEQVRQFASRWGYSNRSHKYNERDDERIIKMLEDTARALGTEPNALARHIAFLWRFGKLKHNKECC